MVKTTRIRISPGEKTSPVSNGVSPASPRYHLQVQERNFFGPLPNGAIHEECETVTREHYEKKRPKVQRDDSRLLEELEKLRQSLANANRKIHELEGQLRGRDASADEYERMLAERDENIRRLKGEVQGLMLELQMLLDAKNTLDKEIAIYRKMLEDGENTGLKQLVEQVVKSHSMQTVDDTETNRLVKGEIATQTSFQRSAKGCVTISECNPDGKFVILQNTHKTKDEEIGGWQLKRNIDNKREFVFSFPGGFVLKPGSRVKIWARGQGGRNNPPYDLVYNQSDTWGSGSAVQTRLYNRDGEERAAHIQRETQSQT